MGDIIIRQGAMPSHGIQIEQQGHTWLSAAWVRSGSPVGHWSADTISGLADDDPVGTWSDQSGNGNDLTQAVAAAKPTYKTNIQNGLPVVRGDGADSFMNCSFAALTQPLTVFVACKWHTAPVAADYVFDGNDSTNRCLLYSDATDMRIYAGGFVTGKAQDTTMHVFTCLFNGASSSIRTDGSADTGDAGTKVIDGLTLFSDYNAVYEGPIDIGECIVYDSAENPSSNEAGLAIKWGI